MMDLYIYYRVPCERAAELQAIVTGMQARLTREHSVVCALKRRPEAGEGHYTWMEIYCGVTESFKPLLQQAVTEAGLEEMTSGARHIEVFVDASTCA